MERVARIATATLAILLSPAAHAFDLVTLRSDGAPPSIYTDGSSQPAITPDGRYVVFIGESPNLSTPAVSGPQVYLRDRVAGTTELVSVSTTGGGANNSSSGPSISDNGCRIVFTSHASNLVAGDTNGVQDVFMRNRCGTPATTRVSISSAAAQGNAASIDGRISGNGGRVVFVSDATNLGAVTNPGFNCLYRREIGSSTTIAIATDTGNCIVSRAPDISADGSRVAFWAATTPGTIDVVNGVWQVYLYDLGPSAVGTQPVIASTSDAAAPQGQGSEGASTVSAPAISPDGGYVAFASRGTGLVAPEGGGNYHVYVKELGSGGMFRMSVSSSGALGNADSSGGGAGFRPGISESARTVTFLTNATNLAPQTGGFFPNVVAHNPRTGRTVGFTAQANLNGQPAISANGDLIVASSGFALDDAFPASRGVFTFPGMVARSVNISTRMQVLTGNDVMIGGFVIGGSSPKQVVVRARGPSLAPFGIPNHLANPQLQLVRSSDQSTLAINNDWQAAANAAAVTASGFAPDNALESAILATLPPGAYTAIVTGVGGGTGIGIVEVFEVDRTESPLINISTRGQVLTGNDVMIGGFIIQGTDPQTVVIRARGPSLVPFGIANALANPSLQLFSGQTPIATNDDWEDAPNSPDVLGSGFAPDNGLESAILVTLNPGAYTAIVTGVGGSTGVGIIEVFAR